MSTYQVSLDRAQKLLSEGDYAVCIRECGAIFEQGLRDLLSNLLPSLENLGERRAIMEMEQKIGNGKSFKRFQLGQLVGLYREGKVFDLLRRQLTSNVQKIRRINWAEVVEWRNAAAHDEARAHFDEDDATQMVYWAKIFLYDCELVGPARIVEPTREEGSPYAAECPECKERLQDRWKFCPSCGRPMKLPCHNCTRPLEPEFKICPFCETPVIGRGSVGTLEAQKAQEEYRFLSKGAWFDGVVNVRERELLSKRRLELGLTTEEAETIERQCAPPEVLEYSTLLEGVLIDNVITKSERRFLEKKAEALGIDPWLATQLEKEMKAQSEAEFGESPKDES